MSTTVPDELGAAGATIRRIAENVHKAVEVRDEVVREVLIALVAEGHVLV